MVEIFDTLNKDMQKHRKGSEGYGNTVHAQGRMFPPNQHCCRGRRDPVC